MIVAIIFALFTGVIGYNIGHEECSKDKQIESLEQKVKDISNGRHESFNGQSHN